MTWLVAEFSARTCQIGGAGEGVATGAAGAGAGSETADVFILSGAWLSEFANDLPAQELIVSPENKKNVRREVLIKDSGVQVRIRDLSKLEDKSCFCCNRI